MFSLGLQNPHFLLRYTYCKTWRASSSFPCAIQFAANCQTKDQKPITVVSAMTHPTIVKVLVSWIQVSNGQLLSLPFFSLHHNFFTFQISRFWSDTTRSSSALIFSTASSFSSLGPWLWEGGGVSRSFVSSDSKGRPSFARTWGCRRAIVCT